MDVLHTWDSRDSGFFRKGEEVAGSLYLEFRYKFPISKHWSVNPYAGVSTGFYGETLIGFDFAVDIKHWTLGVGATHGQGNEIVSSPWRYEIRVERQFPGCLGLSWIHNSNGAGLNFLPHGDTPNGGYNFVMGRFPLYQCKRL